jgi:pyrroloquinoline quinone (PQQ) biosynthesis protein C
MALSGPDFVKKLDADLEPYRVQLENSEFVKAWCTGTLTRNQVFEVMKQFYCYARNVEENFALWAVTCPFDDIKEYFYEQLVEEHYHPAFLLKFAKEWGRTEEEMKAAQPTLENGACYYHYQYLATKHPVERVAAQNFASEATVPRWFRPMGDAAVKHYGAKKGMGFYDWFFVHIEMDSEQHGPVAAKVLEKYAITDDLQKRADYVAKHQLEMIVKAHESFYRLILANP